ncbi:hypothetical protein WJX82_001855 [Trebouxia sp. C0006]
MMFEKCPNATLQDDLTPDTKIDDVKLEFCQRNGLSPETCVLSSKGALHKDQPKSGNKVQLRAVFPPTLAFCVAYSLKPTDASDYELMSRLWQAAAESFCSNKYTAALMSDNTLQSQIAALPAEEILPIDSSQTQKHLTFEAAASHMLKSGGLTLLTAALEQGALVARHAFTVLRHLFAKHTLPIEQIAANEALLARMQGLRRCSALLCPIFSKRAAEAFDPKSMADACQWEGHITFMYGVTETMTRLLASQPLSHPPEAYNGGLVDASPPWPTPTAPQWAEIQTVALRLMVVLEWCTEELALNEHTMEETGDLLALKYALVRLLHQLLLPHMQNPKLSMDRVFRFGFAPIMSEWSACEPDLVLINNLGVAFLRRISSDKAIFETVASAEPGWQHDCVCRIWTLLSSDMGTPLDGPLGGPVHPDPYPYCSQSAEKGNFLTLYASVTEAMEACESWTTKDIVGLARLLTSCTRLFQIMPAHLPQPPLSLAQVMVEMLPSIPEHTSNPCLQEHLIRAALHCMTTVDKQPADNGARILHSAVTAMISMLPLWSSPESPPEDLGYSDIGLPPLEPRSMQARALAMVMPVVELQQPRQRDPALEGCVEWFVNTTQLCMAVGNDPLCPDDRELVCKAYMAPYLKLIGLFTDGFQSTQLPQAVIPKEIARATIQLLFLCLKSVLQAYKTVELACMPQPPGDLTAYDSSLTQTQIATKLADLDTRSGLAVKNEHVRLLDQRSFLVDDVVPFIDKMCRSGVWIEALGQANACYTWCTSRYQADWKRNFGQLLRQHVMSDAVGYKLEVIFGLELGEEAFVLAPGGKSSFPLANIMSWRDDMIAMGAKRRVRAPGAAKQHKTTDPVAATNRNGLSGLTTPSLVMVLVASMKGGCLLWTVRLLPDSRSALQHLTTCFVAQSPRS